MSPVPADPYSNFVNGVDVADGDKVDARFLELYRALNPAVVGLDEANVSLGMLRKLGLNDAAQSQAGRGAIATAAAQAMNANTHGSLATPDRISNLYVPANGTLEINYFARFQATVTATGFQDFAGAAVFVDGSPVQWPSFGSFQTAEMNLQGAGGAGTYVGSVSTDTWNDFNSTRGPIRRLTQLGVTSPLSGTLPAPMQLGLWVPLRVAAGTHTVEVMWRYFPSAASAAHVQDRELRARVWGP